MVGKDFAEKLYEINKSVSTSLPESPGGNFQGKLLERTLKRELR